MELIHANANYLFAQEIDIYVALLSGAYRYDAAANVLTLVAAGDVRRVIPVIRILSTKRRWIWYMSPTLRA